MGNKRILIVDDEDAILTILKQSLKILGPDYEVMTANDGFAALDKLQTQAFDLVVTDYNMTYMDGLELIEAIRYLQPSARVIMITAYGNDELEAETRQLHVDHYFTKPLEIKVFRQVVREALSQSPPSFPSRREIKRGQPGLVDLAGERPQQIHQVLDRLRSDVGARCIFLANTQGQILAHSGDASMTPLAGLASLLGAGLTTFNEAGQTLDKDREAINLAYREGNHEQLYALNVNQDLLLVLVIGRGSYSSRLGTVWYYARQATLNLRQALSEG